MRIDIHTHFFPPLSARQARRVAPTEEAPWLRIDDAERGMLMVGAREFRPVDATLWEMSRRVAAMDAAGVDVQLLSATPMLFGYGWPPAAAADWCERINDMALELAAQAPRRFRTLCQVPLQDVERACREIDRAQQNGHIGVQIGSHVGARDLDDAELVAFLAHCAARDFPVLIHPWEMTTGARMSRYMLPWLVAMPAETHLGILSLILSGAFERLPKRLKICFAHGGGNFAFQLGRAENAWRRRDLVRADSPHPPSHYIDRFTVDSAVFSEPALRLLIDVMGAERVMFGSDAPFPLGEERPGQLIAAATTLSATEKQMVSADNALRFWGLEPCGKSE